MNTYKIIAQFEVYVDSYEQGELGLSNSFEIVDEVVAKTKNDALFAFMENCSIENYNTIDKFDTESARYPQTDVLVDEFNNQVLSTEPLFKEWKTGKKELYNMHISIEMFELIAIEW